MHDDVFQMYLDEMKEIPACTAEEEAESPLPLTLGCTVISG